MAKLPDDSFDHPQYQRAYKEASEEMRAIYDRCPPDRLYLHKPSGFRVVIHHNNPDGTLHAHVCNEFNDRKDCVNFPFTHRDFLEECDLPAPMAKTADGIQAMVDKLAAAIGKELGVEVKSVKVSSLAELEEKINEDRASHHGKVH